jgi:MHS family shikimate/dehydroshikimate transporter-like MFS transporter
MEMKRVILSSIIGTTVEWYDFLIYATASALVFTKLFFPSSNPGLSAIASFSTLGVGYFARPLGAAVFGHFGDRFGRKTMLATTIVIMSLGTFLIGLLPTYGRIGVAAPALLVLLRLLQGVGLGGEWGGAVLMVVENAKSQNRGLLGSIVQLGYPLGTLSAVGVFTLLSQMSEADFLGWAWRIPFLISIFLAGVGLYIRLQLQETPVFRELQAENKVARMPVVEVLTKEPRAFLTGVGLKLSEISYALVAGVFAINYVTVKLAMPHSVILNAVFASSVVALLAIQHRQIAFVALDLKSDANGPDLFRPQGTLLADETALVPRRARMIALRLDFSGHVELHARPLPPQHPRSKSRLL